MSEDERIGYLREQEGRKAKLAGDDLHPGASEEFARGFNRSTVSFGSNVDPRNFGKGGSKSTDWVCVCGAVNKGWVKVRVANHEVCGTCRQERDYVDVERLGLDDEGDNLAE